MGPREQAPGPRRETARSDTFLISATGDQVTNPRSELIRRFVETMIKKMIRSRVL